MFLRLAGALSPNIQRGGGTMSELTWRGHWTKLVIINQHARGGGTEVEINTQNMILPRMKVGWGWLCLSLNLKSYAVLFLGSKSYQDGILILIPDFNVLLSRFSFLVLMCAIYLETENQANQIVFVEDNDKWFCSQTTNKLVDFKSEGFSQCCC